MKKILSTAVLLMAVALATFSQVYSRSSGGYPESLLNTKPVFSLGLANATGQPFRGVATSNGLMSGLFPLKSTGVSTAPIVSAAAEFLAALNNAELSRTQYAVDDPEWRNWSNVDVGIPSGTEPWGWQ